MATYAELYALRNDSTLRNKITVAVMVKAQTILALASPTQAQVKWAVEAIRNPDQQAESLFYFVLAANKTATVVQIQSATDATIQTSVDSAVNVIITGGV